MNKNFFRSKLGSQKNSKPGFQYMVDFKMPDMLSEDFIALIPIQRNIINGYFHSGVMVNYALSLEHSKIWAIFRANSEIEVLQLVADLPLTPLMDSVEISSLTFYNAPQSVTAEFSYN